MSIRKYISSSKRHSNFPFPPETILAARYYETIFLLFRIMAEFIPEDCHRLSSTNPAQRSARCSSPSLLRDTKTQKPFEFCPTRPQPPTLPWVQLSPPGLPWRSRPTGDDPTEDQQQKVWLKKSFIPSYQRLHSKLIITGTTWANP